MKSAQPTVSERESGLSINIRHKKEKNNHIWPWLRVFLLS